VSNFDYFLEHLYTANGVRSPADLHTRWMAEAIAEWCGENAEQVLRTMLRLDVQAFAAATKRYYTSLAKGRRWEAPPLRREIGEIHLIRLHELATREIAEWFRTRNAKGPYDLIDQAQSDNNKGAT